MNYLFYGATFQNKRQSNMDSIFLKNRYIGDTNFALIVVCDGVGSLDEGGFASNKMVTMLKQWFDQLTSIERIGLRLRDAILNINSYIVLESQKKGIQTATTLSALLMVENRYYIVHIGDTRIYCVDNEEVFLLTDDDVSEQGHLSAWIGRDEKVLLQYIEGEVENQTFLVCSDGLYNKMDIDFLIQNINTKNKRTLKESVAVLAEHVIQLGEEDNISISLIKKEN